MQLDDAAKERRESFQRAADAGLSMAEIGEAAGSIAHLAPGRSLADELIEDRRAEARAEQAVHRSGKS